MTSTAVFRLGKNSCLYRNTGTYASPSLTTLRNCKEVKVPRSMTEDDVSARITGGFEAVVATLTKVGITWKMFDDNGVDIVAIRTAFYAQSVVEFFVLSGLATDTTVVGVRMTCIITKFEEDQDNAKANAFDVEVKLTWPDLTTPGTPSAAPIVGGSWTIAG